MFLPYYITSEEVDRLTMFGKWTPYSYDEEYEVLSKIVQNTITAEMIEQNLIKGTKLQGFEKVFIRNRNSCLNAQ